MGSIIAFIIVAFIFAFVLAMEISLEKSTDDDRCYNVQEFHGRAKDKCCPGYEKTCKTCHYKKNYDRRAKNGQN